jgi:apolipoprotein N-acyltransferase
VTRTLWFLLLPLSTAVMLVLVLPDAGWWPLAFAAHAPLWWLGLRASGGRTFLAGWLAGTLAHAGIFHWIAHTAVTMSDFPWIAAVGVVAAYALFNGLSVAFLALAGRALLGLPAAAVTVPAVAVAIEWAWPHLFPWHVGNAFFRVPLLMQGMDVTGVRGGTFVAVAASVALVLAARARSWRPAVPAALVLAAWLAYGGIRLDAARSAPPERTVRLALVQPDITAEDKKRKDSASRKALFARLTDQTRSADLAGVDAVVWPEGAFSFFFAPDQEGRKGWENVVETSRRLVAFVRELGRPLAFGTLTQVDGRSRNSALLLGPDGTEAARYDKRRLLAFGEYMPLSDTIPWLKHRVKEVGDMAAGDRAVAFDIAGAKGLVSICYEAILPALTRESVDETGADFILNLTNDAWFGTSGAPAQHLMVQAPRAVELRMPLVRLTETGITAVVLASGDFVLETGVHERRVDVVDLPIGGGPASPYRAIGDAFSWLCALAAVAALAIDQFRGKKSRSTSTG